MNIYHFSIHPDVSIESAWEELEIAGVEVLYSDEDSESQNKIIICRLNPETSKETWLAKLPSVQSIQQAPDLTIDWESQWAHHGLDFHEGYVHVRVGTLEIILKPGPGFGDASHPTTRLVLQMMEYAVPGKATIDIGCGSGILTLAAAFLEGSPVYAIDIDPEAIRHTIENIALNKIDKSVWVGSANELAGQKPKGPFIALMNMISSEQDLAWNSLAPLHDVINECISSGVLTEEKEAYITQWEERGWQLHSTQQEGDWHAFHFKK